MCEWDPMVLRMGFDLSFDDLVHASAQLLCAHLILVSDTLATTIVRIMFPSRMCY